MRYPALQIFTFMIHNRRAHDGEVNDAELQVGRNNVDEASLGFTLK